MTSPVTPTAAPPMNADVLKAVSILDDLRASLGSTENETVAYLKLVAHVKDMAARMNRLASESVSLAAQRQFAAAPSTGMTTPKMTEEEKPLARAICECPEPKLQRDGFRWCERCGLHIPVTKEKTA